MQSATQVFDPEITDMIDHVDANRIASDIQSLVSFENRNTCSDDAGDSAGIGAARDWIKNQFAAIPGLQVECDPFTYNGCKTGVVRHNLIAWLAGHGDPNRLIVVGGHYDSRTKNPTDGTSPAPGANDSGSQTALVLEAARVMGGQTFDATVLFGLWAGEEQGLRGSASFIKNYRTYFPDGTLELNLNSDIVGGDNIANDAAALQQFRLYSPGTPREASDRDGTTDDTSPSRGIMRHIGYWGAGYVPAMTMIPKLREDRYCRGSDHISFLNNGISAVRFIELNESEDHQHSPLDLFDYVTPAYTARVAQVVVACTATLARASTPPQTMTAHWLPEKMIHLTWSAPAKGPPVHHYVISARPVSENFYRTRFVVPATTFAATASVAEDLGIPNGADYYVSIAAVGAAGHESLYAYPEYRCDSTKCVVTPGSIDSTKRMEG